nr:hypothetical protein BaRGS_019425 [Batillaria attramentaria]
MLRGRGDHEVGPQINVIKTWTARRHGLLPRHFLSEAFWEQPTQSVLDLRLSSLHLLPLVLRNVHENVEAAVDAQETDVKVLEEALDNVLKFSFFQLSHSCFLYLAEPFL